MSNNSYKCRSAGIEYAGRPGISLACERGVLRYLQFNDRISYVHILTCNNTHCLLLQLEKDGYVGVRSGFSSGYGGEGPTTFSRVLAILRSYSIEIDEYTVDDSLLERIDAGRLTIGDLDQIESATPKRPVEWYDYILEKHWDAKDKELLRNLPPVVPLAIVDSRIIDLAKFFWEDPDQKLLKGYRRLEDIVRDRSGLQEHGSRLLSDAFRGDESALQWTDIQDAEETGRVNLFTGAFMAFRNRRAHRESKTSDEQLLREFLLLNHLYRLESEAVSLD